MWLWKLLLVLVVAYAGIVAMIYAMQTRMLFPADLAAASGVRLPASAVRLEVATPEGERLAGVHIPPAQAPTNGKRLMLLGFGGNAWNADAVALYLHGLYPDAHVVAYHYRGYRPSTGEPSAAALLADAPVVHDHALKTVGQTVGKTVGKTPGDNGGTVRVVAAGFSLGSGVAAHLASKRPLAGLILVSPFDSLEALAREHYPWAPVRWFLRHHMTPAEALRGLTVPTAVIAAGRDTIIPPRRTEALRRAVPKLVLDRTIAAADHNDLYDRPEFRAAMVEALKAIETAQAR